MWLKSRLVPMFETKKFIYGICVSVSTLIKFAYSLRCSGQCLAKKKKWYINKIYFGSTALRPDLISHNAHA